VNSTVRYLLLLLLAPFVSQAGEWFVEAKPGYYYLTDSLMRSTFDNGGFSIRGEVDYKFWKPLAVWLDGGYFQKTGKSIGGNKKVDISIGSTTLGLKTIFFLHRRMAIYGGVGPRLFFLNIENHSRYVKSNDRRIGIGGGFTSGFWLFPFNEKVFIDFYVDYSIKKMDFGHNHKSSLSYDVKLDGFTAGVGLGCKF